MQKFLDWWSGKKTIIGSIFLWVGTVGLPFVISTFNLEYDWLTQVVSIVVWIGGILTPLGITHKAIKK